MKLEANGQAARAFASPASAASTWLETTELPEQEEQPVERHGGCTLRE